jgi:hypothetical protein
MFATVVQQAREREGAHCERSPLLDSVYYGDQRRFRT